MRPGPNDRFGNEAGSRRRKSQIHTLGLLHLTSRTKIENITAKVRLKAVANNVLKRNNDTKADTTISDMEKGPEALQLHSTLVLGSE